MPSEKEGQRLPARRVTKVDPFNRQVSFYETGGDRKRKSKETQESFGDFLYWAYQTGAEDVEEIMERRQVKLLLEVAPQAGYGG